MNPRDAATPAGGGRLAEAIRGNAQEPRLALAAFLTAGFPDRERFLGLLPSVAAAADVIEVGVPFSDPMADGATIQRASRTALAAGTTLHWIFEVLAALAPRPRAPLVLMSYLNPLLAFGLDQIPGAALDAGISGVIVPDLPLEESATLRSVLAPAGIALIGMVTPVTPPERLQLIGAASQGFTYAVTMTGTTGGLATASDALHESSGLASYLDRARAASAVPLLAGFGIRDARQVAALTGHADGFIVGSALIEAIEAGRDPAAFLGALRAGATHSSGNHEERQ
jgi:tryptophan synthase alpha chain